MTKQQAINILNGLEQSLDDYCELNDEGKAAFRMAITALESFGNSEQLPSEQPDVSDTNVGTTIYRQAAIARAVPLNLFGHEVMMVSVSELENLPSAQPERKLGKWIYNSPVTMKCDQCGFVIKDWDWHRFKFCPNCCCDMRGEQE